MLVSSDPSYAGSVPTPAPGTGAPVTVPSPDPLQYPAVSGAVISSAQWNSNFWKSYNDINAIAGALNSCSYSTGTGVTSVTATSPIAASIGSCVPGVGTTLSISLAGGSNFPAGSFSATNATNGFQYPGAIGDSGHTISLSSGNTGIGPITCDSFDLYDMTTTTSLMCVDASGDLVTLGSFLAEGSIGAVGAISSNSTVQGSTVLEKPAGTAYAVPWLYSGAAPTATSHSEYGYVGVANFTGTIACIDFTPSFKNAFASGTVPIVGLTLQTTAISSIYVSTSLTGIPTSTGFAAQVCTNVPITSAVNLYYSAEGT
jgi:hypothetical protein